MNKCPRCSNENLKEDYKYCPICGLRLEMNREEVIEQLKDLIKDRKSFMVGDYEPVYEQDIQALDLAIKALEGTALEVQVQEQLDQQEQAFIVAANVIKHDVKY